MGLMKKTFQTATPLVYEFLRADDALFTERVWREIDIREKMNQVFRYKSEDNNGDQRFITILVKSIRDSLRKGVAMAYEQMMTGLLRRLIRLHSKEVLTGGNACDTQAGI
jgi:hypothetical protein